MAEFPTTGIALGSVEVANDSGNPLPVQSGGADLATQTTTAAVLAKLSADPATQATLAAVLAKLSADPATQTSLAAAVAHLATLVSQTDGLEGFTDNLESLLTTLGTYVDGLEALLGPSAATALPGSSGSVTAVDGKLMSFTARETTGTTAAVFRLRAGTVAGVILATVTLAANESVREQIGGIGGLTATGGVYYELVSGTVAGSVHTR